MATNKPTILTRFSSDFDAAITKKAHELGVSKPELVRLALDSFLRRESAMDEVVQAFNSLNESISKKFAALELKTEKLGSLNALSFKLEGAGNREEIVRQKLAEIQQIGRE